MTIIRNLTPHAVNICDAEGNVLATFVPEGIIARAVQTDVCVGKIEVAPGVNVDVVTTSFGEPIDLPEPQREVWLIVSFATANAARAAGRPTDDLLLTSGPVRDDTGRVIGCRRFAVL